MPKPRAWAPSTSSALTHLAKICQSAYDYAMTTMNISLPDSLKSFVDEQVSTRGYGTSSEYVRELIRKDQDRLQLRGLLLAGAASGLSATADATYFAGLRDRIGRHPAG
jgi:antitoxin ParD1/3/4